LVFSDIRGIPTYMLQTITRKDFLGLLDDLFELNRGTLTGREALADQGWDSLKYLEFLALVDAKFDLSISPSDLVNCKTVDDLAALVGGRIGA